MWHKVNFKRCLKGLNSEFTFFKTSYYTKVIEPNLSYFLTIAKERWVGFILFPRALEQSEMQTTSSKIWTLLSFPFLTTVTITLRALFAHKFNIRKEKVMNLQTENMWEMNTKLKQVKIVFSFHIFDLNAIYTYILQYLSIFLRWGIMYIIYIFRSIVLIFVAMFIITFRPLSAPAFVRWLEYRT